MRLRARHNRRSRSFNVGINIRHFSMIAFSCSDATANVDHVRGFLSIPAEWASIAFLFEGPKEVNVETISSSTSQAPERPVGSRLSDGYPKPLRQRGFLLAAVIVALLASPTLGRAERGSVEVLGSVAVPIANEDYKRRFDDGRTYGIRVALGVNDLVAIDASVDFNSLDERARTFAPPFDTVDAQRLRFLGGGRIIKRRGPQHAFLRIAAGIEVVHMTGEFNFAQMPDYEETDSTIGAVFQLGGGLMIDIRRLSVGGQVALSQAWHPGVSSKWEDLTGALEDDGLELEISFVGAIRF